MVNYSVDCTLSKGIKGLHFRVRRAMKNAKKKREDIFFLINESA